MKKFREIIVRLSKKYEEDLEKSQNLNDGPTDDLYYQDLPKE